MLVLFASKTNAIGKLLKELGIPEWTIWVLLGAWVVFLVYRRMKVREQAEKLTEENKQPDGSQVTDTETKL